MRVVEDVSRERCTRPRWSSSDRSFRGKMTIACRRRRVRRPRRRDSRLRIYRTCNLTIVGARRVPCADNADTLGTLRTIIRVRHTMIDLVAKEPGYWLLLSFHGFLLVLDRHSQDY